MSGQHIIDFEGEPYHPEKLERKEYVGIGDYFALDLRAGKVIDVEEFPENIFDVKLNTLS